MFEIQAENRDLTDRDINQPKETHKRGCYLALTFGTLLSSQGADAQQLDPFGFSSLATSHGAPLAGVNTCVGSPRPGRASAAQQERRYTTRRALCTGAEVARRSSHPGRPELDAHPRADRPGR